MWCMQARGEIGCASRAWLQQGPRCDLAPGPVLFVRVDLTSHADPPGAGQPFAKAEFDVDGRWSAHMSRLRRCSRRSICWKDQLHDGSNDSLTMQKRTPPVPRRRPPVEHGDGPRSRPASSRRSKIVAHPGTDVRGWGMTPTRRSSISNCSITTSICSSEPVKTTSSHDRRVRLRAVRDRRDVLAGGDRGADPAQRRPGRRR